MTLTVYHFLVLSALMFLIGAMGVLLRRNTIIVLMSLELMLNSANLALVTFSRANGNLEGQVAVFLIMAIAAAEVAIGLAIIVKIYRDQRTINVDSVSNLKR
jgi:NADH-quinone oxidoreductase subunit K